MANPSSAEAKVAARGARKAVRRAVEAARSSWVDSVLAVVNADGTLKNKFCGWKTDFTASCMACDLCSSAWAALSRRGEAFEAAERSKWRKTGPVRVDRRKQKGNGRISQDSFLEGWPIRPGRSRISPPTARSASFRYCTNCPRWPWETANLAAMQNFQLST